jgi:CelD/BcsL family acetyltransferase involved in cellulose biosynthesis
VADFFGADPYVTEIRGVLCDPAHERRAYAALLAHVASRAADWDCLWWRGMRAGGDAERLLATARGVAFMGELDDWILPLPPTWEEFRSARSRNMKESLRHGYNSLARAGHEFALHVVRERREVASALEIFFHLHRARACLRGTVVHRDVFASRRARRFLLEASERLAERDRFRAFQLHVAGKVVATRIGFADRGVLYLYFSGYDPAWSRFGVMTTTVAEAVKCAIAEGCRAVNLSTGTDVSKTRWSPERVVYRTALQRSPSWRGALATAALRGATRALERPSIRRIARAVLGRGARLAGGPFEAPR